MRRKIKEVLMKKVRLSFSSPFLFFFVVLFYQSTPNIAILLFSLMHYCLVEMQVMILMRTNHKKTALVRQHILQNQLFFMINNQCISLNIFITFLRFDFQFLYAISRCGSGLGTLKINVWKTKIYPVDY